MDDLTNGVADVRPAGDDADRADPGLARRVDELEALLAAQQAVIARLERRLEEVDGIRLAAAPADREVAGAAPTASAGIDIGAPTSRRALMTRGAAAAAGAALVGTALSAANASPAAAATGAFTGDPAVSAVADPTTAAGVTASSDAGTAVLASTLTGAALLAVANDPTAETTTALAVANSSSGTAVKGAAPSTTGQTRGVHGTVASADGLGVVAVNTAATNGTNGAIALSAHGGIAMRAEGTRSHLYFLPSATPPFPSVGVSDLIRFQGELAFDTNKDLWICVSPGTPGDWRRLAGRKTAGSLSLLDATTRIYDSRPGTQPPTGTKGIFASHEERTIDCAAAGVSTRATAVLINATATNTNPGGFFAFFKNGTVWPNNSSLSWGVAKSTIANLAVVAVDNGKFTARMEGAGGADLVVDCIGYYQ